MIEKLSVLAYFVGWRIVRFLPENMAYGLFRKIADLITNKNGGDVKRLRENLRRVKP